MSSLSTNAMYSPDATSSPTLRAHPGAPILGLDAEPDALIRTLELPYDLDCVVT